MNIKIECACGTRYSFDVEPRDGRMPAPVQCPACHADGTQAANQIIAETSAAHAPGAPALRLHHAPPDPASSAAPEPEPPVAPRLDLAAFKAQKRKADERAFRKGARLLAAGLILLAACLGAWGWYALAGSMPRLAASLKLKDAGPARVQFLGPAKILIVTKTEASLRDISLNKILWSVRLRPSAPDASPAAGDSAPQVFAGHDQLWICAADQVQCLDAATGAVKQTVPILGRFVSFAPAGAGLLVVSAPDETRRIALRIELPGGAVSSREITVPRPEKQTLPGDLPPNVLPTAAVLTSQILEEKKFNKPLDAVSSEFFSAGQDLVELRVKLLEAKVTYVQSIKPRGPSQLNSQITAGSSPGPIGEEIFNDLKRSQTGGVRAVDESRYEVRLRRWLEAQPVEWKDEVTGPPSFFPLATVDLLVAGQTLTVFDRQNNKLFDSKLSYRLDDRFTAADMAGRLIPAVERNDTLYFFDQGVLTAYSLPRGEARWRLPSFGISALQFDDQGMLYVDSTTAGPEDIQYADTINFERIPPVLLKVDAASGKILWKAKDCGRRCLVSGKFLYAEDTQQGGAGIVAALGEALNAPPAEAPVYFHLYRLDPTTGANLWSINRGQRPDSLAVQGNRILLRFGNDLQLFKFLSF
jgi:outer membrane protein assembly factor BamB